MLSVQELKVKLAHVLANKGIPPFVLANNISEANYDEISLYKRDQMIIVDMYCKDDETGEPLQFKYMYNKDEVLLKSEMIIAGRSSVMWDREAEIAILTKQIQQAEAVVKL
ncbi:hypothetical protein SK3146_03803 [Paenibacillus konkukensis]|uniref:Uncharacterized protein n=2 Tax=Paenibacillus TaxID=44249 RepID=A0ABQ4M408_9BACL|nr:MULTISPECIES: hypothetical protein [Paenibacillus]UQZ84548.1 hypothetical protein SK3146_03803 [Paenibacillus konkukensis]GIO70266.1 hypothetical protein J21TS3_50870 [Paenibacillus cookii]